MDSTQIRRGIAISSNRLYRPAGVGIISMTIAVLLLIAFANMNEQSGWVLLIPLFLIVLGLIIPIWMFIRSVLILSKKESLDAPKGTFAIVLLFC